MKYFANKVAVITDTDSDFGREFAPMAAALEMKLVLADVQPDSLEITRIELEQRGTEVVARCVDVARGNQVAVEDAVSRSVTDYAPDPLFSAKQFSNFADLNEIRRNIISQMILRL